MENQTNKELEILKNELTLGKELAKQLQIHHTNPSNSSSNETRESLINKILNSYDKALHMLTAGDLSGGGITGETTSFLQQQPHNVTGGITGGLMTMSESPRSLSISPRSEDSDHHHRDFITHDHCNKSKKSRKSMPKWTKYVQVSPGNGLEGPLDDQYSWRKYGQKDILGAKYPRGYYRCTLRHVHGCMATKQIQRTDDDQTIFEITYHGTHTCNHQTPPPPPSTAVNQEPATSSGTGNHHHQKPISPPPPPPPPPPPQLNRSLVDFPTGLKVRTENLEDNIEFLDNQDQPFDHSVNFCTAATSANGDFGSFPIFGGCSSSTSMVIMENDFGRNPCPSLMMSPATSGSSYFGARMIGNPSSHVSSSAATSSTTSPRIGVDFPIDQMEFAPDFSFENPESFS